MLILTPAYDLCPQLRSGEVDHQVSTITRKWDDAADAAGLTTAEREQMFGRQILNPAAHYVD